MRLSLYYLKNKNVCAFVFFIFLVGVYIASIRIKYPESYFLDDLYFMAREGKAYDANSDGFDIQTLMSILTIVISIPIVCGQFASNYKKKQCYIAIRYRNYIHFYLNEWVNIFVFCFLLSLFYSFGIFAFCFHLSSGELHNSNFPLLYCMSVLNSTILLLSFSVIAIPFCIKNSKTAILCTIFLFMALTVISFYLPEKYKCFDIITLYFVNTLFSKNQLITDNSIICYAISLATILLASLYGCKYLKTSELK